ncbi:30S ribosome-binding factor RbfA [Bacteroidia bacterium]|jgi:ribosome-binding factor A|nr:30S ribosome-binding factor RbfA [Bacteroidota bacterium]MDA8930581.1 30S ribosome-binding factor RbfA [Bacteroidia bacterium]MDB4173866.1 30S ribosome-binding factor RbfA [Bacteroidia bacterium]
MSIRTEKISRAVQRDLAPLLSRFCQRILPGQLVTVVEVKATADLGLAKIYVSVLNSKDKQKSLDTIGFHNKEIRQELAQVIGKRIRKIPELNFYLDETMDHAERINSLLDNL